MSERRPPTRPRRRGGRSAPVVLATLLVLAAGCTTGVDRPRRPRGSAVWVDPQSAPLTVEGRRTLARAGVEEVFLEAATLSWEGGEARLAESEAAFADAVPQGTPVTLVVRGEAPPEGADPGAAAGELLTDLQDLRYRAEQAGLLPVGVHFDLDPGGSAERLADLLRGVRQSFAEDLLLSTSIPSDRLGDDAIRKLAGTVDFIVAFLYGQAPGAHDDSSAWDPQVVAAHAAELEEIGADYVVGLHVVGRADHLDAAGELQTTTTRAALKPLASDPSLRLSIDDPFAGVGRLVHTFQAQGTSRAAGWRIAPGERIRVVQTAPGLLRDVMARIEATEPQHHTGYVFHRVAGPEEELSLVPAELAAALGGVSPVPDLHWKVVVESEQEDSVVLGIELENRSRQRTDLAATDGNYLEIRTESGYFDRVVPGGFSRYTLRSGDQEARPGTAWRRPDGVRLHTPMVAGGERIGGAVVSLHPQGGEPSVFLSGRFFLPDGSELEIPSEGGPVTATMTGPAKGLGAE